MNIGVLGDRFLAMTETALPVEFDRRTLEAAGVDHIPHHFHGGFTSKS